MPSIAGRRTRVCGRGESERRPGRPHRRKNGAEQNRSGVGYHYCRCHTCMEIYVGEPGQFCAGCTEAGCPEDDGSPDVACRWWDYPPSDFNINKERSK